MLDQKIPGFKFNLGFSGKGYLKGNEEEDDGDEAILENAHKFTWFGHLFDHEQPHKLSLKQLIHSMTRNKIFAEVTDVVCFCYFRYWEEKIEDFAKWF